MRLQVHGAFQEWPGLMAFQPRDCRDVIPGSPRQPRILHVGAEDLTVTLKLVNLRVERALYVGGGTAGAERETIFVAREISRPWLSSSLRTASDCSLAGAYFFRSSSVSHL